MSSSEWALPQLDLTAPDGVFFPLTQAQSAAIERIERFIPGPPGAPEVRVVLTRPQAATGPLPVILHVHGGGFSELHPESFPGMEAYWSLEFNCCVVSVDYRLAPEHPFPAAPEDCYAALIWTAEHAAELDIDPDRLVATGGSAGGALCAALCLMTRDRYGPPIAFQALTIPVLDDRLDQPSYRQAEGAPGFNTEGATGMWIQYLGADYDRSNTSPYAAPMRAADLTGLPPAFIQTAGLDPLRDEGIQYAMRLMAAGVDVELYNAPGNYHGADVIDARAAVQATRVYYEALAAALASGDPAGSSSAPRR